MYFSTSGGPSINLYILRLLCFGQFRRSSAFLLDAKYVHSKAVNDAKFVQYLIETGADINARNRLNKSALSIAIAHSSIDVVRLVLT